MIRDKAEVEAILSEVQFRDWTFHVGADQHGDAWLQVRFIDADSTDVHRTFLQQCRKWRLSPHMTKSEVVQTAFLAVLTAVEHEAREHFKYRGHAIFGPHFDVDDLASLCAATKFDERAEAPA